MFFFVRPYILLNVWIVLVNSDQTALGLHIGKLNHFRVIEVENRHFYKCERKRI